MDYARIRALRRLVQRWLAAARNPAKTQFEAFRSQVGCETAQSYGEIVEQLDARMLSSRVEASERSPHLDLCLNCQYFSIDGLRSGLPCAVHPKGPMDTDCADFEAIPKKLVFEVEQPAASTYSDRGLFLLLKVLLMLLLVGLVIAVLQ